MALSATEKLKCFEILEAFWSDTATITNNYGVILSLSNLDTLKNDITTRLGALDAESVAIVQDLIAEWNQIRTLGVSMTSGSTGPTSGINLDPDKMRQRIRHILHTYVPVINMLESIMRKTPAGVSGGIVPVFR